MKKIFRLFGLGVLLLSSSCELEEKLEDSVVKDQAILDAGSIDPATALNPIYNSLAAAVGSQGQVTAMNLHSSDELIPPVRGTDWYDFGVWTTLHTHQWDPSHPQLLDAWNTLNQGVVRANQAIVATSGAKRAQARWLRAYFIWYIVDLFGKVPFRAETDTDFLKPPPVKTRTEATAYIISELEAIKNDLPDADYGNPTKYAAYALLAKVYLNKFIYEGKSAPDNTDMIKVIEYADLIEDSGLFSLANGDEYFTANFGLHNENSPETIFALKNESGDNRGASFGSRYHWTLHYNQNPSGWNGFTTIADFYNKWDKVNDKRFKGAPTEGMQSNSGLYFGFLEGQQKDKEGKNLTTRNGKPLSFTVDVPLTGATEAQGVRVLKYEPDFTNTANPTTDYPLLRWADVLLMRSEAYFRSGQVNSAQADLNTLRNNRAPDADPITVSLDALLNERGFELYWEGHRRTDLIRFGKFTQAWNEKPVSESFKTIFPIPQNAVDANPNLTQYDEYLK